MSDEERDPVYLDPKDWTPGRLLSIDLHILYALIEQNQETVGEHLVQCLFARLTATEDENARLRKEGE